MKKVRNYLSLIRFSHTIFAMPFALIGFALAVYKMPLTADKALTESERIRFSFRGLSESNLLWKLAMVVLCMIFARSAAMAFNRYLDRHFDARNPRTAIREIPAGVLQSERVLLFTIISSLLFMACAYLINTLCFLLSPVALTVVLGYSYTKRFTALCHLVLGLGLSLAPIGAYLAVSGRFDILPVCFSLMVIGWVSGFDIIYALQDEEFDRAQNLYSIPALLGKPKALAVSRALHVLTAGLVLSAGLYGQFGSLYWVGALLFAAMLVYQQTIVKPNDLRRVNLAFMTANGVASVVFAIFVIADLVVS